MKTDIRTLINNTNITGVTLLNYYKEEIWIQYDIYDSLYKESLTLKDEYEIYINKEKQKEQRHKIKNLIKEFSNITKYMLRRLEKTGILHNLGYNDIKTYLIFLSNHIHFIKNELRYEDNIKNFIVNIIGIMCRYYDLAPLKDTKGEEQKNINDYYIAELNRILDEKEAKIYELEIKSFQDEQDINALINKNNELKRALEINREGEK